jgi:thiosulfate dehydrogenase (quinone) large subunit
MDRRSPASAAPPGLALLPLRLFLGVTFVYAGFQKLSDPGFLTPGSQTYVGTQLHGFATGTPGGFVLRWLALPFPRAAGVGVALAEIAIGLLAAAGLLTRAAAAAGLGLNLLLFLTASWHTSPYFLGSDIVFVFAWLPFVLAGSAGQPAADTLLVPAVSRRSAATSTRRGANVYRTAAPDSETRRTLLGRGLAAASAGTLAIAGLAVLLRGGSAVGRTTAENPAPRGAGARSDGRSTTRHHAGSPARVPAGSVRLGASSALPAGHAATYRDPRDGSADIVVRHADGSLAAFSAICTHAGCQVDYASNVLYCPCHGSEFDASTGAVLRGPAATPLARRRIVERRGSLYAVS